ncbi:MAG: hypothetical protein ABIT76_13975 [Chthoniobacterales bacterium]
MPNRRLPNSTPAVLRTFQTAHDTYLLTPVASERAITAEQFAQLDLTVPTSLFSRFKKEASEVDLALAAQAPLSSDLAVKVARLTLFVSHFHQVLDLGIVRGDFAVGARTFYGRDITATTLPDLTTYVAVAEAAQKIVDGETARATAEGASYQAMALPSAAEVGSVLTAYKAAASASQTATLKTDQERENVSELYPEAQELAVDLCDTIEFFYRKDPSDGSRRTKCQRWGVVYLFDTAATPVVTPPVVVP